MFFLQFFHQFINHITKSKAITYIIEEISNFHNLNYIVNKFWNNTYTLLYIIEFRKKAINKEFKNQK